MVEKLKLIGWLAMWLAMLVVGSLSWQPSPFAPHALIPHAILI